MSNTDTPSAATPAVPTTSALDQFFANIKADWQIFEEDVIVVIQNIGAGVEVAAEDLQQCLSWLGSHIGQVAATVTAVQNSVAALNAAGVAIPSSLTNGIAQINQAVAGVNSALSGEALSASASSALTEGYNATKQLQVAASSAAAIAATIQAATAPVAQPTSTAGTAPSSTSAGTGA